MSTAFAIGVLVIAAGSAAALVWWLFSGVGGRE
jgi:hypothetical protein